MALAGSAGGPVAPRLLAAAAAGAAAGVSICGACTPGPAPSSCRTCGRTRTTTRATDWPRCRCWRWPRRPWSRWRPRGLAGQSPAVLVIVAGGMPLGCPSAVRRTGSPGRNRGQFAGPPPAWAQSRGLSAPALRARLRALSLRSVRPHRRFTARWAFPCAKPSPATTACPRGRRAAAGAFPVAGMGGGDGGRCHPDARPRARAIACELTIMEKDAPVVEIYRRRGGNHGIVMKT